MQITPSIRVHRTLAKLSRFFEADESMAHQYSLTLQRGEAVIGVYDNSPSGFIVITNQGLHIVGAGDHSVLLFRHVEDVNVCKSEPKNMRMDMADGTSQIIVIEGSNEFGYDAFTFERFLKGVYGDIRRR